MEVNEYVEVNDFESDVFSDNDGYIQESVNLEKSTKEGEEDSGVEDQSRYDNDSMRNVIDYAKLESSVRDAQIISTLDSDLNDLPVSDVILLIITLVLGILLVGGKGR